MADLESNPTTRFYDTRLNSVQAAIRFAKFADLLGKKRQQQGMMVSMVHRYTGIVSFCDPLLEAPNLIKTIKENGLLLFSYGQLNNLVENVETQRRFGVDAVIVDKIVPIVSGMKGNSNGV